MRIRAISFYDSRRAFDIAAFHDLRHTSATLLLAQGVHAKVVQERLGPCSDKLDPRHVLTRAAVRLIGYRLATAPSAQGPDIHVSREPPSATHELAY